MPQTPTIDLACARHPRPVVAPWVREPCCSCRRPPGRSGLRCRSPPGTHGGGVLCGQSMMAAADTAMILAVCTHRRVQ